MESSIHSCPSVDTLLAFASQRWPTHGYASLEEHIHECGECRAALEAARAGQEETIGPVVAAYREDEPRYLLLERLGSGSMGVVYRAFDSKLEREVAIKFLAAGSGLGVDAGDGRALREARAMARTTHPNIVAIHDTGAIGDEMVIAMELAGPGTLRTLMRKHPPGARPVLHAVVQAGKGLAAAHCEGLVHRDFKPENVLIGVDGRARVGDFGLAAWDPTMLDAVDDTDAATAPARLTGAARFAGTPAYAAPEQLDGAPPDPRSDQYSFCVVLFEALTGTLPHAGTTIAELLAQKRIGASVPQGKEGRFSARRNRRTQKAIEVALLRGLSPDPAERWNSLDDLVEALSEALARRRNLAVVAAVAGLAVVVGGVGWASWAGARAERCAGASAHLDGVWDAARRTEVEAALLGTGRSYAGRAWEHTASALDGYAAEWVQMHAETCEATTVRQEQSRQVMDKRMACLDRARKSFGVVVSVLATADPDTPLEAHDLIGALRPLSRCADLEALSAELEPPLPGEQATIDGARDLLEESRIQVVAGHYASARVAIDAARAELGSVEYCPLNAEADLRDSEVLEKEGDYETSAARARASLESASSCGHRVVMGEAARKLMYVVGILQGWPERGLEYRELAQGLAKGDSRAEASVRGHAGLLLQAQNRYPEAEAEYDLALALGERVFGPDHRFVLATRTNRAFLWRRQGRYVAAEEELRQVIELAEGTLGQGHPDVTVARGSLVAALLRQGKYAVAEAESRRVVQATIEQLGRTHPEVATGRFSLMNALSGQGKHVAAQREARLSLTSLERTLGPRHRTTLAARQNLANNLAMGGDRIGAEAAYRRLLVTYEETLGAEHRDTLDCRFNLGGVLHDQEKYLEAEAEFRVSTRLGLNALGAQHPDVAESRAALAGVLLKLRRPHDALEFAEQAWSVLRQDKTPAGLRASAAETLARTLWATASDPATRTRVRAVAAEAIEAYSESADIEGRESIQAWLATLPRARRRKQ